MLPTRIIAVVQSVAVEWPKGLAVALKLDTEKAMSESIGWPLNPLGPRVYMDLPRVTIIFAPNTATIYDYMYIPILLRPE